MRIIFLSVQHLVYLIYLYQKPLNVNEKKICGHLPEALYRATALSPPSATDRTLLAGSIIVARWPRVEGQCNYGAHVIVLLMFNVYQR